MNIYITEPLKYMLKQANGMVYKLFINKAVKKKNRLLINRKKKYEDSKMNVITQAKFICQHVNTRISQ